MLKIFVTVIVALCLPFAAMADDDDDEHRGFFSGFSKSSKNIVPKNVLYQSECGSCHFAFQANLLPSDSWEKMMLPQALTDHFGDNAEIEEQDRLAILEHLVTYAADNKGKRLLRFGRGEAPLRITELRYFIHEHDEMPKRMVQGNPDVRSLSNCLACHTDAAQGRYKERNIRIPNYGAWED